MLIIERSAENPVLLPNSRNAWEDLATFNGSPLKEKRTIHMFYRALGHPEMVAGAFLPFSTIGRAESADGIHFASHTQFVIPQEEWEKYGCEDQRVTKLSDKYYVFYTTLSNAQRRTPIMSPIAEHAWENKTVFNPVALYEDKKTHLFYRAMETGDTSVFGYAMNRDSIRIDEPSPPKSMLPSRELDSSTC